MSKPLLRSVLKKGVNASELWKNLEKQFRTNKDTKAIQLDHELRNITIGDRNITEYGQKIKELSDLLANIDSSVPEKNLVMYLVNGLNERFGNVAEIKSQRVMLPTFDEARGMLLMAESGSNRNRTQQLAALDNPSSPTVLYSDSTHDHNNNRQNSRNRSNDRRQNNRGHSRQNNRSSNSGRGSSNSLWAAWGWLPHWGPPPPWAVTLLDLYMFISRDIMVFIFVGSQFYELSILIWLKIDSRCKSGIKDANELKWCNLESICKTYKKVLS